MQLSFFKFLFAAKEAQAFCWMLVHSLWQGLAMAIIGGVIILSTRKSKAATRYNLLIAIFLLFIAGITYTFFREMNLKEGKPISFSSDTFTGSSFSQVNTQTDPPSSTNSSSIPATFMSFLNNNAGIIVLLWVLIIAFRCIRLVGGLYRLEQVRQQALFSTGEFWNKRLKELAAELGIRQRVQFLQSGLAKVPMVLGHFKPLLLFPIGLINSITPEEVEAILVHELAHIRRKDYIVNILQHFIDICFFFNPAILWISSLIREERENCCDDIAVAKADNKRNYIKALISFQEYHLAANQSIATALTGKKYHLLQRVKRIIYNSNKTLNAMEKFSLTSGILVAGFLALTFSPALTREKSSKKLENSALKPRNVIRLSMFVPHDDKRPAVPIAKDTVPENKVKPNSTNSIETTEDGKRYRLILKNNEIAELYVDGVRVPDDKIKDYSKTTTKIILEANENWEREMTMARKAQEELLINQKIEHIAQEQMMLKLKAEGDRERFAEMEKLFKEKALEQKEGSAQILLEKIKAEEMRNQEEDSKRLMDQLKNQQERSLIEGKELSLVNQQELQIRIEEAKRRSRELQVEAEVNMQMAKALELQLEKSMELERKSSEQSRETMESIIKDLREEKIITDKKELSFQLNNKELIVNGVKQPDTIHKKLKEKYLKKPGTNYDFNNKDQQ